MSQLFQRWSNTLARGICIFGALGIVCFCVLAGYGYRSSYFTGQNVVREQPVPFSHQHHVGGLGLDCRFCHTSVEESSFAGIPPTETCMICHSQIWTNAPMLEPIRASYKENKPLQWTRVNDLPDFVYFNHSIHVKNGVACADCHGRVDEMPMTVQKATLHMRWCLDCHENPRPRIHARGAVFDPKLSGEKLSPSERQSLHWDEQQLRNCSTCHH
jgi:hypothetical protein